MPKNVKKEIGKNVEYAIDGNNLILTIDLSADAKPSMSGKTLIIASTQGNKKVDGEVHVGLNVYKYAAKKAKK